MRKCRKRQKIVKQGNTFFRCMNKKSSKYGCEVNKGNCENCTVNADKRKSKCAKKNVSDKKVLEMLKEDTDELEKDYPPLTTQLKSYKDSLIRWKKAGKPTRSDTEVNSIINNFCNVACSWYDPDKKRCKGCGCKVSLSSISILNKVRMATEHCPRNYW